MFEGKKSLIPFYQDSHQDIKSLLLLVVFHTRSWIMTLGYSDPNQTTVLTHEKRWTRHPHSSI